MSPAQVNTLLQVGLFAIETYAAHKEGQLSEDELTDRWTQIRSQLDEANAKWESAKKKS